MAGRCLCALGTILGLSLVVETVRADSTGTGSADAGKPAQLAPGSTARDVKDPVCDMILIGCDMVISVLRSDPWLYNWPLNKGDTVLDVVAKINGLPASLSKKEIWVERPRPGKDGYEILPVDWKEIVKQGISRTNYLLQPGDRIYIKARKIKQTGQAPGTAELQGSGNTPQKPSSTKAKKADTMPPYRIEPPDILLIDVRQGKDRKQVSGEKLVRPDGTIGLSTYGSVYVAGLTVAEAGANIEHHLSQWLPEAVVSVDILSYNSKHYFIIVESEGGGEQLIRLPITGNETVLDAVGHTADLPPMSEKKIWVVRPDLDREGHYEVLPVNWKKIAASGDTSTNYQLLPGDRVYIEAREVR